MTEPDLFSVLADIRYKTGVHGGRASLFELADALAAVTWRFHPGGEIPPVPAGEMHSFIVLTEHMGERATMAAYYLNAAPLVHETCVCVDGVDHDPSEGCPSTGWYYDHSNPEWEHCFYPVEGDVLAWCELPSAEAALRFENA